MNKTADFLNDYQVSTNATITPKDTEEELLDYVKDSFIQQCDNAVIGMARINN